MQPGWDALAAHIAAHPVTGTPAQMRLAFAGLAPKGPEGQRIRLGGVACLAFGPLQSRPVIWAHGGGLVFGSPATHASMAARVAHLSQRRIILPDYRLAPEHPWPSPLHDILAVMDACGGLVDLAGDSAGGQLALCATLARKGVVGRLALISPNTDRTGRSTTRGRDTDVMNTGAQDAALARFSFGKGIATHPDASPLLADLSGLPPVWITAATAEVLFDDTLLLLYALNAARVPTIADIRTGLCHLWPLWPDALPQSTQTLAGMARFLAIRELDTQTRRSTAEPNPPKSNTPDPKTRERMPYDRQPENPRPGARQDARP